MENRIVNKNDFIEHIRQWVVLDSQMKIINEKTKVIRERKHDLNTKICHYAKQNNMKQKITITDGQLSFYEKKDYTPLTYGYVEKCLGELIPDKKQVEYIIQYMKDHREVQTNTDIRRTYDKKLSLEN
jgi:hypothetical protein